MLPGSTDSGVKGGNGEIIASSEGYATEQGARRGLEALARVLAPYRRREGQ